MSDERLQELIAAARAFDGTPPFSDGALVEFAHGERELLWLGEAAALADESSAEFVVAPDARRHGHGTRMLDHLITRGDTLFWAHGDHPGARALARRHGLIAARELLHLEAAVPAWAGSGRVSTSSTTGGSSTTGEGSTTDDAGVTAFTPADADAWLELNARAFAGHPEQGAVTRQDLDVLTAEPWFDAGDFLLLRDGDRLIGYCWLKLENGEGEFYVVGVDPERQGEGIGRRLVAAGMHRFAARGIDTAHLYVEGDNAAALRLYRSFGFGQRSIDIQYRVATAP